MRNTRQPEIDTCGCARPAIPIDRFRPGLVAGGLPTTKKGRPEGRPNLRGRRQFAPPRRREPIQRLLGGRWRWLSRQRSIHWKSGSGRSVRLGMSRSESTPHRW